MPVCGDMYDCFSDYDVMDIHKNFKGLNIDVNDTLLTSCFIEGFGGELLSLYFYIYIMGSY